MNQHESPRLREPAAAGSANHELVPRIVSGAAMIVVALALTWSGLWPFWVLALAVAITGMWEWNRIVRGVNFGPVLAGEVAVIFIALTLAAAEMPLIALALLALGVIAIWLLVRIAPNSAWSAAGLAYLGIPAVCLIYLRSDPDYGWYAILYIFLVVWSADIGAYVAGRLIGGPKLAPRISPNKTWAGAIGGLLVSAIAAFGLGYAIGGTSPFWLAIVGACLAAISQIGDLAESAVKRFFHVKDASQLIPGHGGILDRIDALLFAGLAAGLLAAVRDGANPGLALLIWP